jgi:hypothetical protein
MHLRNCALLIGQSNKILSELIFKTLISGFGGALTKMLFVTETTHPFSVFIAVTCIF